MPYQWHVTARDREVTIVIPSYANTSFLPAAIESAIHSPACSVIIADDGNGSAEREIFQRYATQFPGVVRIVRSETRRGIQRNLNAALEQVRTAYFVRLDCDDVLYPGHVEHAIGMLRERPLVALAAGGGLRIHEEDCLVFRPDGFERYPSAPQTRIVSGLEAFRFILRWNPNPCSSGTVYRTSALRAIGGFDERVPWADDWEVWLRLASRWEVAYVDAPAALYRIHPQSTTNLYVRQNRLCYGYDYIYRRAAELCREPAFSPDLRRAFLRVAKYYAGAAWRSGLRPEAFKCGVNGLRALYAACSL
jgi:cellulose synthase/poly-beta-1,6-N-acetylglucosamine synthase-like glycosyltransferase